MALNAGKLDRRVQFLRAGTIDDGFGNTRGEYAALGSPVYAARRDISDAEKFASGSIQATLDTRFTVRSSAFTRGITPADRLASEGLDFDIIGIKQIQGRQTFLEITCTARVM